MQAYLDTIKHLQASLLKFIDDEDNIEENYQNLISNIDNHEIKSNKHEFLFFIRILTRIITNHHVSPDFYSKIEKIILYLKKELTQYLKNDDILDLFKGSKRILLFLIKEKILNVDEYANSIFTSAKYKQRKYNRYFFNEIKPFLTKLAILNISKNLPKNHEELRESFKEPDEVFQIIQNDDLAKFIEFTTAKKITILNKRAISIFETNYLFNKENSIYLIDYAAFYGSIEIFKYLLGKNPKVSTAIWLPAIHSNNLELIHILEKKNIKPDESLAKLFFKESIKCHHNDIANYIQKEYLQNENIRFINELALKYNNLLAFSGDFGNKSTFFDLCKYDYHSLVKLMIDNKNIDFNARIPEGNAKIRFYYFYGTALNVAVEYGNEDIVQILISIENLDINSRSISIFFFNIMQNQLFKLYFQFKLFSSS